MSSARRLYLDTGVLISAFRGESDLANRALEVLDDPNVCLVVSEYVDLEVLPKPVFHRMTEETEFMRAILDASERVESTSAIREEAFNLACAYGLGALDALHVSAAVAAGVEEVVTSEKSTKPICRVEEVSVRSLYDEG
ncbi:MAG: PIN domain-containing protein [Ectothiorhodospiraceae bacterium]|nr:PIN domain-containing protein [Ectothiorhodospiraceae bacterium]